MNLIMLDIDGVLNTPSFIKKERELKHFSPNYKKRIMKPELVNILKNIIDVTNAKIILTSTWRLEKFDRERVKKELREFNILNYLGRTPEILGKTRGDEINAWFLKNKLRYNVGGYVIIDDIDEFDGDLKRHFVKCNGNIGLTNELADLAIKIIFSKNI